MASGTFITVEYCKAQHQRICQLEGTIQSLLRAITLGPSAADAGIGIAESVLSDGALYHSDYAAWLERES